MIPNGSMLELGGEAVKKRFFGHACLRFDGETGSVLIDPWFTREGAFFRSWFQFPENAPLRDEALDGVRDLIVSHNHADHFDPETLRHAFTVDPERRLHIARFATSWFRDLAARALGAHADRIVEHEAWETFEVGDLEIFFVPEESPGLIDSAIVIRDAEDRFVNLNDARLNTDQMRRIHRSLRGVSQVGIQGSGASEYPVNYRYDDADMRARRIEKRALKLKACATTVDLLDAERVLFFAGPPCFVDPRLEIYNDSSPTSVFPHQLDILEYMSDARPDIAKRAYFVTPGDLIDDEHLFRDLDRADPRAAPFIDPENYVREYRERRADIDFDALVAEDPDDELLAPHFEHMAGLSRYMAEKIGGTLDFRILGPERESRFCVDFSAGLMSRKEGSDPLYRLEIPAALAHSIARGEHTWDDAFLSLRMSFDELTDRFVAHFKTLLKYMDDELFDALEDYERGLEQPAAEHIEVTCAGKRFSVQRHCPHAGVDLGEHGEIDEESGAIVCTAHRFIFDLDSGACRNAKGYRIETKRLD
jgi:UDP-MurNAc hydroxylase